MNGRTAVAGMVALVGAAGMLAVGMDAPYERLAREVAAVYEGLGRRLEVGALRAGCEAGVARLINQRVLMRRTYPWLPQSDDVKKVLQRRGE